jgi:hypothetical protein
MVRRNPSTRGTGRAVDRPSGRGVRRRAGAEVVDHEHGCALAGQQLDDRRPDEPRSPGHQRALDRHGCPLVRRSPGIALPRTAVSYPSADRRFYVARHILGNQTASGAIRTCCHPTSSSCDPADGIRECGAGRVCTNASRRGPNERTRRRQQLTPPGESARRCRRQPHARRPDAERAVGRQPHRVAMSQQSTTSSAARTARVGIGTAHRLHHDVVLPVVTEFIEVAQPRTGS